MTVYVSAEKVYGLSLTEMDWIVPLPCPEIWTGSDWSQLGEVENRRRLALRLLAQALASGLS